MKIELVKSRTLVGKVFLTIFLILLTAPTFAQETKFTAAVMDLTAEQGISESTARMLSDYLRSQLFNTGKFTLVTRENMEQILKEQAFQLSGCTSQECVVQAGQLLGVRKMFAGTIGKVGETFLIGLKVIDVESGKIEKAETEECHQCKEDALLISIRNLSRKIVGLPVSEVVEIKPSYGYFGSLFVDSWPEKGEVYLNDILKGKVPFSEQKIASGVYKLKVTLKNCIPFEDYIQIPVSGKQEVFLKKEKGKLKRINSPGYAYETKWGILVRVWELTSSTDYISAGVVFYSPYLRICGSTGYGYEYYPRLPSIKGEILANIPLDRFSIQFGFSYSYIYFTPRSGSFLLPGALSLSTMGTEESTLEYIYHAFSFPVGFESFLNPHLSFSSLIGFSIIYNQYIYKAIDTKDILYSGGWWRPLFLYSGGVGINYYF